MPFNWRVAISAAVTGVALVMSSAGRAQQPVPPQSTFRAATDLVQVDVSVLDKKRLPVRGLTAADFTLLEDGQPRPVVAFTAIDLPDARVNPGVTWLRDVAPDVASNELPEEGRLVVILMDRSIPVGQPEVAARAIASSAIDNLGPGDLAAVIYTGKGVPQNLTSNRAQLKKAVNHPDVGWGQSSEADEIDASMPTPLTGINSGTCYCGLCVLEAVTNVATSVRDIQRRRKSLVFIGSELVVQSADVECGSRLTDAREKMLHAIDLANLTVHVFDPIGLETRAPTAGSTVRGRGAQGALLGSAQNGAARQNNLAALPTYTGGQTVLSPDAAQMREVFQESGSYYLLGFEPSDRTMNGRSHAIEVKVNRRGLEVRTRRGYVRTAPPAPSAAAALATSLPDAAIPLALGVATFASTGPTSAVTALVLSVRHLVQPAAAPSDLSPLPLASHRTVHLVTGAFTPTGREVTSFRQSFDFNIVPNRRGEAAYELLSRLNLKPGRYEIRAAIDDEPSGQRGSVYTTVDVPNFSEAMSMSDLVVSVAPAMTSGPSGALSNLLPVVPTARRDFQRTDRVTAFARVYQPRGLTPLTVGMHASIRNASDTEVFSQTLPLERASFDPSGGADYRLEVPVSGLAAGDYLLRVEASLGMFVLDRHIRFRVK